MRKLLAIALLLTLPSALLAKDLEYVGLGRFHCSGQDCERFTANQEREERRDERDKQRASREIESELRDDEREYREIERGYD